jgi:Zinc-finger double-stranded RNA-binding
MKPIGQILRDRRKADNVSSLPAKDKVASSKVATVSLEEQIRLLEMELGDDSDGESDSASSESDSDTDDADNGEENMIYEKDNNGNIIRIVSKICEEAIEPLSVAQLPQPMCSKGSTQKASFKLLKQLNPLSGPTVRFADDVGGKLLTKEEIETRRVEYEIEKKRRAERKELKKRPRTEEEREKLELAEAKKTRISGLEKTVKELLTNYIPAALEKKAFYCRICRTESEDLESFESHKKSEFHNIAAKMEQKMSYCSLCRKQFTSPNQLTEHLAGKGHKDYLVIVKERQLQYKEMSKFR